MKARGKK